VKHVAVRVVDALLDRRGRPGGDPGRVADDEVRAPVGKEAGPHDVDTSGEAARATTRARVPGQVGLPLPRRSREENHCDVDGEFAAWVAARSWRSGDGPKAIFTDGIGWLRERKRLENVVLVVGEQDRSVAGDGHLIDDAQRGLLAWTPWAADTARGGVTAPSSRNYVGEVSGRLSGQSPVGA
jgi:hypothetical protein